MKRSDMKRRTLVSAAGLGLLAATLPAFAAGEAAPKKPPRNLRPTVRTAIGKIRAAGVLKVAVIQQFPWAMLGADKKWSGFDIDVCNKLAEDLGVKAEFVDSSWDGAADDVVQNIADVAASLWPTPRRSLVVNFSHGYGTSQVTLVASRAKAAGLTSAEQFDQANVTLGVRAASEGERFARNHFKNAKLRVVKDEAEALAALEAGEITAMVALTPLPEILAARAPAQLVMPLAQPLRKRTEAFALRADEFDLLSFVNTWIQYREEIGWLPERRAYWFGGKGSGG